VKKVSKYLLVATLLLVVLSAVIFPVPARALSISNITPNPIINNIDNEVTITGDGFEIGAKVVVGSTQVYVTLVEPKRLIVRIDVGFLPGTYSVIVTNPSSPDSPVSFSPLDVIAPTPTVVPTSTPVPTATLPLVRPQIVIDTYSLSVDAIRYGEEFSLDISLDNAGGSKAYGMQVTFTSTDLLMLKNGGVLAAGDLDTAGKAKFGQTMTAAASLAGRSMVSVDMNVSYSDEKGTVYTDKFPINLPVAGSSAGGNRVYPTATPTGVRRSQLVVSGYETDVQPLQPGTQFMLSLLIKNVGTVSAKSVTMIIGGGSVSGSGGGTPQAGVSGGSGEFTNFAPVGSSNIQSLGDLAAGASLTAKQNLVVNVSTNPGAFPMKVAFSYLDDKGNPVNDEQIITLLVYSLPVLDVSFYQAVGTLMAGQPNTLPLQVVNLGKKNYVLGKMKVKTTGGMLENAEGLVGSLDPGGYFTLDSMFTPDAAGTLELMITIDYTDDFNEPRTITKTLTVDVIDASAMPTPDSSMPSGDTNGTPVSETFMHKLWRFILGLLGLDSGTSGGESNPAVPTEAPVKVPMGGGGKG
jgi:hypothetical protein